MAFQPKEHGELKGWFHVPGNPYFLVNRKGELRNAKTGYTTQGSLDDRGYRRVCQWDNARKKKKDLKAHVLICTAFHGPKPSSKHEVGHKDHKRDNNVPSNLRWVTRSNNMRIANRRQHGSWESW